MHDGVFSCRMSFSSFGPTSSEIDYCESAQGGISVRRFNKLRHYTEGPVDIIEVTGRFLTEQGDDELCRNVEGLLAKDRKNILIDLSGVTFISSMGIGSLIQATRLVEAAEGRLKLLSPAQCVRQILAISKLDSVFEIEDEFDQAVSSYNEPRPEPKSLRRKKTL